VFLLSVFLPAAILTNDRLRPNTLGAFKVSKALTLASAHCRRPSPIGYLNAPRSIGKSLIHDPERAPLVRRAFDDYATRRYTKNNC
jgi:hypothetical protein